MIKYFSPYYDSTTPLFFYIYISIQETSLCNLHMLLSSTEDGTEIIRYKSSVCDAESTLLS